MAGEKEKKEESSQSLDLEKLKDQDKLNASDEDAIWKQAMKEIEEEEKGKNQDPNEEEEKNQEKKKKEEKKPEEGQEQKKEKEEEEELPAEETPPEESAEEKAKKAEDEKLALETKTKEEEEKAKAVQTEFEKEIKEYSQKHGMPEDVARKVIEGEKAISEKYANDPKKLSRAYRHQQSEYSRIHEENKLLKEQVQADFMNPPKVILAGKAYTQEEAQEVLIAAYRKEHQEQTEDLEDAEVWAIARKEIKSAYENERKERVSEQGRLAAQKKLELLTSLSESDDKKFLSEIKPILEQTSDAQILSSHFDLTDMLLWAKGKSYDKELKEAEERGFKRGQEQAKILGEKPPVGGGTASAKKSEASKLSDSDMKRANEMFGDMGLTKEQIIEYYKEHLKEMKEIDNKTNKK